MLNEILKNKLEKLIFPIISNRKIESLKDDLQQKYSYAFNLYVVSTILGIDINMVNEYITDGSCDCGIDAIHIEKDDENFNINFFQSKYFKNIDNNCIGENELLKVKNTVLNIMNGKEILNCSLLLSEKIKEIRMIQNTSVITPKITIYFVSNVENISTLHYNAKKILDREFKDNYFSYQDININDLFSYNIINNKERYVETITASKDIMKFNIGGIDGYVFNLKATELIQLYKNCGKENIFSNNIRYFLKHSKINLEIQNTIKNKDDSKYFWFFNNGISIIAEAIEAPEINHDGNGNRRIKITNPSIINGGQTTKSLYKLYDEQPDLFDKNNKNIDSIQILVRAYQTTEESLIDKITKGTNRQNVITQRDLISNNKILKQIQIYFKDNGVNLEIKSGEFDTKEAKTKIKSDALFQMYVALYEGKPHSAKNNKTKILNDYCESILEKNTKNVAQKLFRSYWLWKFVNEKCKNISEDYLKNNIFILNATFSIMYLMSLLNEDLKDINKEFDLDLNNKIYDDSIIILRQIVDGRIKELTDSYNNNLFFKSFESTSFIEHYIINNKK